MLTSEERVRALLNNIKSWSWDIYPKFTLHKEDAEALREYFKDDPRMKGAFYGEEE